MSVLSRKQKKYIDRLFYQERQLREAVGELRAAVVADAADSADPTARQAVEAIADLPEMNGEHPDNDGLLDDLLSNGIITQAEYDALSEAIEE